MKIKLYQFLCLSLMLSIPVAATADTELENTTLSRIVVVLDSLKPLINQAEQEQDRNSRMQFHYDWLRSDIAKIKAGINQQLKEAPLKPRPIKPIRGDYLTLQGHYS